MTDPSGSRPPDAETDRPVVLAYSRNLRRDRACSESTIRCYTSDLKSLSDFSRTHLGGKKLVEFAEADLELYLDFLRDGRVKTRSIVRKISCIKLFYRFLHAGRLVSHDPSAAMTAPQIAKERSATIPPSAACEPVLIGRSMSIQARNLAIALTVYGCGVLPVELVRMDLKDVDFDRHSIHVRCPARGHGRCRASKERDLPLGHKAENALLAYLTTRPSCPSDALFVNPRGMRLTTRSIQNIIKASFPGAPGIATVNPRVIRHSFAEHLLGGGAAIPVMQQLLGHSGWSTHYAYHDQLREQGRIRSIRRQTRHKNVRS
jgi:integrase/recombinase XerC